MKIAQVFIFIFLVSSCVYDPPREVKELLIHNQTGKSIVVLDSLSGTSTRLYDSAIVNGRSYIGRKPNYIAEYGVYPKAYSSAALADWKRKKTTTIRLYILDSNDGRTGGGLIRSFQINLDTLESDELNHVFILRDTILWEHDYHYSALR